MKVAKRKELVAPPCEVRIGTYCLRVARTQSACFTPPAYGALYVHVDRIIIYSSFRSFTCPRAPAQPYNPIVAVQQQLHVLACPIIPTPLSHHPIISSSHSPVIPSSHYPIISSSRSPIIPFSHHPITPISHHPVISLSNHPIIPYPVIPSSHYPTILPLSLCLVTTKRRRRVSFTRAKTSTVSTRAFSWPVRGRRGRRGLKRREVFSTR